MKKLLSILTNKFLLTGVAFLIYTFNFDQNNWSVQEERKKELRETDRNIAYLKAEISKMEQAHFELTHNPEQLEKFAREHYKMKRDTEDLYIVEQN